LGSSYKLELRLEPELTGTETVIEPAAGGKPEPPWPRYAVTDALRPTRRLFRWARASHGLP
jgi:hypothetical protein